MATIHKGMRVWVGSHAPRAIGGSTRSTQRAATIAHPFNPKYERDLWVVRFDSGHESVWDGSLISPMAGE